MANPNNFMTGQGGLTLGAGGAPDAVNDATHKYAKGDVWVPVSPAYIVSTTLPALTRTSAGVYHRTLAASTTHNVLVPFPGGYWRTFSGTSALAAPHGIKVRSLILYYRVNTTTITSFDMTMQTVPHAVGAAIYTATDIVGVVSGNTLTAAANIYGALFTVTTPAFVNTLDNTVNAEAVIVIPGSSTVDVLGASWRVSVALY